MEPRPGAAGSGRRARGAGASVARARAAPDPVRADGGVAVRVLPRRGGGHGDGPRVHADHRDPGAGVRRRARHQLREVRDARAQPRLRHQRLRRDGARARGSGTSSACARACTSSPANGASPRARATGVVLDRGRARTGSGSREYSTWRTLELWYERTEIKDVIDALPDEVPPTRAARRTKAPPQGPPPRGRQAHAADGRRASRFVEDPPLIVHLEDTGRRPRRRRAAWSRATGESLADDRRDHVRPLPGRRRRAQGRRGRQRRDAVLDRAVRGTRRIPRAT